MEVFELPPPCVPSSPQPLLAFAPRWAARQTLRAICDVRQGSVLRRGVAVIFLVAGAQRTPLLVIQLLMTLTASCFFCRCLLFGFLATLAVGEGFVEHVTKECVRPLFCAVVLKLPPRVVLVSFCVGKETMC